MRNMRGNIIVVLVIGALIPVLMIGGLIVYSKMKPHTETASKK